MSGYATINIYIKRERDCQGDLIGHYKLKQIIHINIERETEIAKGT